MNFHCLSAVLRLGLILTIPGAYCIQLLPEKNCGYFNQSLFSHGKVNGKILLTRDFGFYRSFLLR